MVFFMPLLKLFPLFTTSPQQKSRVFNVLKRASSGRFFNTKNTGFFVSGLSVAIGAMDLGI